MKHNKNKVKLYKKKNAGNVPANNAFFNTCMGTASLGEDLIKVKKDGDLEKIVKDYVLDDDLVKFIKEHRDYIKDRRYADLYNLAPFVLKGKLSEFLLYCNIDPLKYMSYIPSRYLQNSMIVEEVEIPSGYDTVGQLAFSKSWIKKVYIPKTIESILLGAFRNMKQRLVYIEYEGTYEQWNNIQINATAFEGTNAVVHCIEDGQTYEIPTVIKV